MKYSKGIMWLDDCRIPFNADDKFDIRRYNEYHDTFSSYEDKGSAEGKYMVNEPNTKGRFTPNLLVCDDMLNDGSISKSSPRVAPKESIREPSSYNTGVGENYNEINDKGSNSRYYDLDKWFDKMLNKN